MPSFTAQIPNLLTTGPIIEVQISPGPASTAARRKAAQLLPPPIRASAMIDTGASGTVIQAGIAERLDLTPIGVTLINTPSSTNVRCYEYEIQLVLPNGVGVSASAIEAPLQGQNIQCLIGRDVLAHGVLIYVGYMNSFTLSF